MTSAGRIFISYRREDTAYPAGWLFDRLAEHFGPGQVFKDVDSVDLGDDFAEVITTAVGSCDVLLALIGDRWLSITDDTGRRRLDDPDDFVRLEIETALARGIRVIPILVGGARIPRAEELPPSVAKLARRQALELSPSRFEFDTNRLLKVLDQTLADVQAKAAGDSAQATPTETNETVRDHGGPSAAPPAAPEPSPPDRRAERRGSRLSTRTWIVIGSGAAVAVVLLVVIVAVVGGSDTAPPRADRADRAEGALFTDDFSGQAAGWQAQGAGAGEYAEGGYLLRVKAIDEGLFTVAIPTNVASLNPTAPTELQIEVDARRTSQTGQNAGYGIFCRGSGSGEAYTFTIWDAQIIIAKTSSQDYQQLDRRRHNIDRDAANELRAVCTSEGDGQHLVFAVNGQVVAEATDTSQPFSEGTVGLVALAGGSNPGDNSIVAEFDNFVVTEVSAAGD